MLIAQISDPHVTTDGTMIRALVDTPQRLVDAFGLCAALPRVPDVILMTGDLVNDARADEYELLAEAITHSPSPILPIPGNHDDPALLHATFAVSDRCGADLPDPASGPFHYSVDDHEVRLVAFDATRPEFHSGMVTAEHASWLDATLAERPDHPTIVFMHHTPFATGAWWFDYNGVAGADLLREVVTSHPQVRRVVCGHVHRAASTQWGHVTVSSAPSTAFLTGTGIAGGPPLIIDQRSPVALFSFADGVLTASETDLPGRHPTVDLREISSDWDTYEPLARRGGPVPKDH